MVDFYYLSNLASQSAVEIDHFQLGRNNAFDKTIELSDYLMKQSELDNQNPRYKYMVHLPLAEFLGVNPEIRDVVQAVDEINLGYTILSEDLAQVKKLSKEKLDDLIQSIVGLSKIASANQPSWRRDLSL